MTATILNATDVSFVNHLFDTFFARSKAPGLALAITHNGEVLHSRASGHRSLAPLEAVYPSTPFRIASMSKCFAAVALLMLRDNGLVSLDATVQQAVPTLKLTEPFLSATLHDLIAMRLDLPVDDPWADRQMGGVR